MLEREEKSTLMGTVFGASVPQINLGLEPCLRFCWRAGGGWEEAGHVSAQSVAAQDSG